MTASFVHEIQSQRVVFAAGAIARVADEAARLGMGRALVIATPGSGARLGARLVEFWVRARPGCMRRRWSTCRRRWRKRASQRRPDADGLVAAGGGAAIGLAKIIARDRALPILAVPTTYSGSEATAIWGMSEGERKFTGKDARVLPRTIVYDPDLTLGLPAAVSAASAMNAIAHCVEGLWVSDRTPFLTALASDATRRFAEHLPRVIADGSDRDARAECLIAAWLAGTVLTAGTALQHKLAHVLGGLGLPHAETHAIILPHVTRFNLAAAPEAHARLAEALSGDPARAPCSHAAGFPDPATAGGGRVRSRQGRFRVG